MAIQANPGTRTNPLNVEIVTAARDARRDTKRLARQLRTTVQSLARLEAACEAHGIKLEVEPNHTDQES
jgi:sugar phosphate isomerase/epimerase